MIESDVKTKDGWEKIIAHSVDECASVLPLLTFKPLQRNHKITYWASDHAVFDTETSHDCLTRSWIYQWAFKIKNTYIYGRTPAEFIELLGILAEHYRLTAGKRLIIFIHNASYDLQYLKWYLRKYDPSLKWLTIDAHTILSCDVLGIRMLCSYKLTNMGLDNLSRNYAEKFTKAVGEIDYTLVKYQDSELTPSDWFYMFSDVASQDDGIRGYLKTMGYKYAFQAPMTSTGFIRVDCRKAANNEESWRQEFIGSALQLEMYNLARWTFAGGVCITSYLYAGETVRGDLGHDDFTSSYPARQILDYMPIGAPSWYGDVESIEELEDLCSEYCCIFVLHIKDVHIKPGVTAPCIPSSKCRFPSGYPVCINGKVVYAPELYMPVCELDYKWIKRQYNYNLDEVYIDHMMIFSRGSAPEWLKREVMKYFENKCTKKSDPTLYAKSKAHLNSVYGMTATAILRDEYEFCEEDPDHPENVGQFVQKEYKTEEEKVAADLKKLNKYYKSYNSFMPYQLSIWTTAHSRDALYTMIETVGYENFLYCDTDSVYYKKTPENVAAMERYREYCRERARSAGAYFGDKYLGEPTPEEPIRAFRSLHAKCYAVEELNPKTGRYELKVTIAGIPKKATRWVDGDGFRVRITKTNAEELGRIGNLENGFTFHFCGGTRCIYNEQEPEIVDIDGHRTEISSSAVIDNIDKVISDRMYSDDNGVLVKLKQEQL